MARPIHGRDKESKADSKPTGSGPHWSPEISCDEYFTDWAGRVGLNHFPFALSRGRPNVRSSKISLARKDCNQYPINNQLDTKWQRAPAERTIIDIMSILESGILQSSLTEICTRVKHLGYTTSGRVRLYGEEFEVVSEPFADAEGIAVHAKSRRNPNVRVLRLPSTVVQSTKRHKVA